MSHPRTRVAIQSDSFPEVLALTRTTATKLLKLRLWPSMSVYGGLFDRQTSDGSFRRLALRSIPPRRPFPSGSIRMFLNDSFLPFGSVADSDSDESLTEDLPPDLRRAGRYAYRRGWEEYRKADCPFGPDDKAMLIWFSFRNETETPPTVGRN